MAPHLVHSTVTDQEGMWSYVWLKTPLPQGIVFFSLLVSHSLCLSRDAAPEEGPNTRPKTEQLNPTSVFKVIHNNKTVSLAVQRVKPHILGHRWVIHKGV